MAIYHFSAKIIGRKSGRSSTAAAAYRSGAMIHDERTGETHDYRNKPGILDHAILTPARAPNWAKESASLWNRVEAFEKRKDAQLVRETVVALPHELSLEQNRELLHGFVREAYIQRGMVAQIDIHAPDKKGNHRNIHAHIMLTTRQITRDGFKAKKPRNWNERGTLKEWRALWANHVNQALERAGKQERVDSRSFKDRGLDDKEPSIHLGVEATAMERRGEKSRLGDENRAIDEYNREREQMDQEQRIIDAAIKHEEQRPAREKREQAEQTIHDRRDRQEQWPEQAEARRNALWLSQLDERRKVEDWADMQRYRTAEENKQHYDARSHEKRIKALTAQLNAKQSVWDRMAQKPAALRAELEAEKRNLADAKMRESETLGRTEKDIAARFAGLEERHALQRQELEKRLEVEQSALHTSKDELREEFHKTGTQNTLLETHKADRARFERWAEKERQQTHAELRRTFNKTVIVTAIQTARDANADRQAKALEQSLEAIEHKEAESKAQTEVWIKRQETQMLAHQAKERESLARGENIDAPDREALRRGWEQTRDDYEREQVGKDRGKDQGGGREMGR